MANKNIKKYDKILLKYDKSFNMFNVAKDIFENAPCENYDIETETVKQTTTHIVAPSIFLYVLWVLRQAKEKGIKRLYFLARDAEIFFKAAKIINERFNFEIDCRYLYSSRLSWRLPSYYLIGKTCISLICTKCHDITLDIILNRLLLNDEEKIRVLELFPFSLTLNELLNDIQLKKVTSFLADSSQFLQLVYTKSKEHYTTMVGYIAQEGLLDDVKMAIVDTGWTGTMQFCLNRLIKSQASTNLLEGFYFGLYDIPEWIDEQNGYHTWYFDKMNRNKSLRRKIYFNNNLFECLCTNLDGMTESYIERGGQYYPVLQGVRTPVSWDKELQINLTIQFVEAMCSNENALNASRLDNKNALKMCYKLLKILMTRPAIEEAELYGKTMFSDDTNTSNTKELAPILTSKQLSQYNIIKKLFRKIFHIKSKAQATTFWLEGSITRSDVNFKHLKILNSTAYNIIKFM